MEGSKIHGTGKSKSKSAPMNGEGGNLGKPVGDTGTSSKKGNRRTRQAADRYK